jgi:hypothetical protein
LAAKSKRGGLGKGLDAIFIDNEPEESNSSITLKISEIEPNKSQPRKEFDENALADSLDRGHLGGAALDVFKTEPLPEDSRLWNTPGLLITPHIAGNLTLDHTVDKNVDMFLEDLDSFIEGKPLKYAVDMKKGY